MVPTGAGIFSMHFLQRTVKSHCRLSGWLNTKKALETRLLSPHQTASSYVQEASLRIANVNPRSSGGVRNVNRWAKKSEVFRRILAADSDYMNVEGFPFL